MDFYVGKLKLGDKVIFFGKAPADEKNTEETRVLDSLEELAPGINGLFPAGADHPESGNE